MFRIDIVFKNDQIELHKVSGEIRPPDLTDWQETLQELTNKSADTLILDFCEVTYFSPEAVNQLLNRMTTDIFIFNGSASIRNLMYNAGISAQLLG